MARRSVVMDGELRYFEVSVPCVEALLNGFAVRAVLSHYVGDFADANIYKPVGRRSLEDVLLLAGAGAKSGIKEGSGAER
jgi:hypothetical protein